MPLLWRYAAHFNSRLSTLRDILPIRASRVRPSAASVRSYQHTLRITTPKSVGLLVISQCMEFWCVCDSVLYQLRSLPAFTDGASVINVILSVAWRIALAWHRFAPCGPFCVSLWGRSRVSLQDARKRLAALRTRRCFSYSLAIYRMDVGNLAAAASSVSHSASGNKLPQFRTKQLFVMFPRHI